MNKPMSMCNTPCPIMSWKRIVMIPAFLTHLHEADPLQVIIMGKVVSVQRQEEKKGQGRPAHEARTASAMNASTSRPC